jgi:peptide chain release factor 1
LFANEAGGHRWQRVPPTEKKERVQTSTITVAVMPEPDDKEFKIDEADLEWSTTRGSGAGGQNRNKVETVAVVKHLPTGVTVRAESERSQHRNKICAMRILRAKLQEMHSSSIHAAEAKERKDQIGSGQRGDKRRTIRVKDGQVKDHVTGRSWDYKKYVTGNW